MKRRVLLLVVPLVLTAGRGAGTAPPAVESASPAPAVTDARMPLTKAWDALRTGRYRVEMRVDVDVDATHVVTGFSGKTDELITLGDSVLLEATRMLEGADAIAEPQK